MGIIEFWKNRTYWQKGAIIGLIFGLLVYFWLVIRALTVLSVPISRIVSDYFIGIFLLVLGGILFGFIGFMIGIIINKCLWKRIVLCLITFLVIPVIIFFVIQSYNYLFGFSCNIDSDCVQGECGFTGPPSNNRYIRLYYIPKGQTPACLPIWAVCENNRCENLNMETTSIEYCERRGGSLKSSCYWHLARNLNDSNFCDKMEEEWQKKRCIEQFENVK